MKKAGLLIAIVTLSLTACQNENTNDNGTKKDNNDTAVLVKDPHNTLDAKPVKDTTVKTTDTVMRK